MRYPDGNDIDALEASLPDPGGVLVGDGSQTRADGQTAQTITAYYDRQAIAQRLLR